MVESWQLQERMFALIRSLGLHQADRTPCGQPVPVSVAHAVTELAGAGGLTQLELGSRLCLEKSTVSRLVQKLAERGWVTRRRDADDGRLVRVHLTASGAQVATQLAAARAAKFAGVWDRVPIAEREQLLDSLTVLVRALSEVADPETGEERGRPT